MFQTMKNVVITGSSTGSGEGAAKAFTDKGYRVWAIKRDANGRRQKSDMPLFRRERVG